MVFDQLPIRVGTLNAKCLYRPAPDGPLSDQWRRRPHRLQRILSDVDQSHRHRSRETPTVLGAIEGQDSRSSAITQMYRVRTPKGRRVRGVSIAHRTERG